MTEHDYKDYANSDMTFVIDEYVHNEVHREILRRKLTDEVSYKQLADETGLDPRTLQRILDKYEPKLYRHLDRMGKLIDL